MGHKDKTVVKDSAKQARPYAKFMLNFSLPACPTTRPSLLYFEKEKKVGCCQPAVVACSPFLCALFSFLGIFNVLLPAYLAAE